MDGMGGGARFNDHELQKISGSVTINGSGADEDLVTNVVETEPSRTGLDRSEVAEVVYLRAQHNLSVRPGSSGDTQNVRGHSAADIEFLINEKDQRSIGGETEIRDGNPDSVSANGQESDDLGLIDEINLVSQAGHRDTATGTGGAGSNSGTVVYDIPFYEMFSEGPVVDRFDQFRLVQNLDAANLQEETKVESRYFLYLNVKNDPAQSGF